MGMSTALKRVLASASILAAFMTTATGMAAADAGSAGACDGVMLDVCTPVGAPQPAPVADVFSGSAEMASVIGTYGNLIGWMQGGSSSKPYCGGMCGIPVVDQATAREVADSGSSELGGLAVANLTNFPLAIMNALQTASGGPCTAPLGAC